MSTRSDATLSRLREVGSLFKIYSEKGQFIRRFTQMQSDLAKTWYSLISGVHARLFAVKQIPAFHNYPCQPPPDIFSNQYPDDAAPAGAWKFSRIVTTTMPRATALPAINVVPLCYEFETFLERRAPELLRQRCSRCAPRCARK